RAGAFFAVERRADRAGRTPLVPPSLFELVSLRRGLLLILPFSMGFAGFMFVIAVALQEGAGRSPVQAGLALVPLAVTFLFTSVAGPRLIARHGTRVVTAGAVIQGVGLGLMILAARSSWPGRRPRSSPGERPVKILLLMLFLLHTPSRRRGTCCR